MKYRQPLMWAIISLIVGMAASFLQNGALREWYPYLNKPSLTPPDGVFPVAWTILYVLMGVSIGLIRNGSHPARRRLTGIFLVQLAVNFFWSIGFFYFRSPAAGLCLISGLFLLLLLYIAKSWPVDRAASFLFMPYAVWVGFAWYLNFYIFLHN